MLFFFVLSPLVLQAQEGDDQFFNELKKKVQLDSYYDSASVFNSGSKAIDLARKLNNKAYEAEILILYGNHFYYVQRFDKSEEYFKKAYTLALESGNKVVQRTARIRLTFILESKQEYEKAEIASLEILEEARKANDYVNQIECLNSLALLKERFSKADEAMAYFLQGLKISEEQHLDYYTAVILNNMGLMKSYMDMDEEALADFEKGLELSIRENSPRLTAHLQNNIGLIYLSMKKIDEGLAHYKATLHLAHIINHPKELAISYINYGTALHQAGRDGEAMKYYDSALVVLKENNMKIELAKGILGKSSLLLESKHFTEAVNILRQGVSLCEEMKNLEDNLQMHRMLYKIYDEQNFYEKALSEYKTYTELRDSLERLRNTERLNELQVKYNVEKKRISCNRKKTAHLSWNRKIN